MKWPTMDEFAQMVADKAMDEVEYNGKTLREWIEIISNTELGTNLAEVGTKERTVKGYPIDADLLMAKVDEQYGDRARDRIYQIIRYMPKYELPPIPPPKGKWIKTARWGRVYYCNQCRNYLDFDGVNAGRGSTNFCPNCGADMRGEQDG